MYQHFEANSERLSKISPDNKPSSTSLTARLSDGNYEVGI